ncbi:efflux RND transporter periplasmic adaptor subunit [Zymomonas mobilis]|uniref:Efflux transporter, RND family, MFP subunit n=1 Tax=Zymomonas mobilis subsp. mobilis (strain ATCC 31821 / ZM4 / CP4) TaxID=264203 RepID=A0A806CP54_ZYMMO|nr:efflux RND transporter periplasmic adaptor subunit [Zymomonas mobilis]ADC33853.1 efflux transporter, RND family, MFP subunit [Zymomonas mobilis subsp. mobilis ZM4 = ATCC 31821]AHB11108.1 RND family efflux transporter, MFP subunit [Zymomonas mobilis subsp. mobilis str. CP4 = NRRL B-14023]AHJ71372.1 multidrug efflux system subunit MdtA [Zymomonas mobilis subsp. mobilis NRRL B-12526]AHJ73228.1 multidrug efflux system subunit MdtA [Zymomonas mobilis subsp. mobilis str. CP4 = NRRL B-14023]TWE242
MAVSRLPRLIAATLFVTLGLVSCKSEEQRDPRIAARVVQVAYIEHTGSNSYQFTGIVAARVQSDLGFRIYGKIIERLVDVGQQVKAGQVLMRLDPTDYVHALTAQTGSVASARAIWVRAAADERRYHSLLETGAIAALTYDEAKAAADSAKAQLDAAVAQEKVARNQDDYSLLRADTDGVVVQTHAEPGQVVSSGQTVIVLAHAGPREARIDLPEGIRPTLHSKAQASLYGGAQIFPAYLRQLSEASDATTRTYEARYVLEGKGAAAPLGATVQVIIPADNTHESLQVPLGALDDEGEGQGIWVVDRKTSRVSFHKVEISRLTEENAVLRHSDDVALKVGATIVAIGGHYLHPNEQVTLARGKVAMQ